MPVINAKTGCGASYSSLTDKAVTLINSAINKNFAKSG
ncbi:hypothetical protein ASZ90_005616 [hydrocarbon metagenome]|uniref:Uncharacterized protein n=1 Tax=hydrocarbon metagenome TaxID=938273 RepID=A0A0W8FUE8_9ZZZZ